ncbi:hypothetical protein [Kribbella sindirgiensis]|uniref:Uncharacterized protein n=1 Tax=Kribbella sindirgiensis TaxID=1124744 RepID=A0A4R0J512_9ACTN|nr:hypothetical protein [Kribbella sindirgiensis]TCC39376.1 hypothetical protein E0H50_05425 [Kribbella sindirgiensis]
MDESREDAESDLPKGTACIERLVADGISEDRLASCRELAEAMRLELGLDEPLSTGGQIVLLRTVLTEVVKRARREALANKEQFTHEESGREHDFRIAAAGELLRIPDPENTFETIQEYRGRTKKLPDYARGSARQRAKLRAALWLGATATKTAERLEEKVSPVLVAAMASYAREQRGTLRALLDEDLPTRKSGDDTPVSNGPEPAEPASRRKWYVWAAAALVVVAGLIWGGIALFDDKEPSGPGGGPTPGPSTSTGSSSTPSLAGQEIVDQVKPCASLPRDSQAAKDLRSRRQVVVDGRCFPDPTVDVGTQAGPTRDSADVVLVSTGQILNNVCLKSGQETSDMVGTKTKVWVRFDVDANRQAFISAIWTQAEEGADPC